MPKYYSYKICGYYLYYTEHCIIEAMHVHASDSKLSEYGSAKFFVRSDGSTIVKSKGILKDYEITKIQKFIKEHYLDMYKVWSEAETKETLYTFTEMTVKRILPR